MRRSACFLTIVGLSLNAATAQDLFGPSKAPAKPASSSLQFYSANAASREAENKPVQRYERQENRKEDVPNYYGELFGTKPVPFQDAVPASTLPVAPVAESRTRLKPASSYVVPSQQEEGMLQAEYQTNIGAQPSLIQQVRADGSNARPFPGQAPGQSASELSAGPGAWGGQVRTGSPQPGYSNRSSVAPSLTTPIQIEVLSPADAVESPVGNSPGNVTFSHSLAPKPASTPVSSTAPTTDFPTIMTPQIAAGPQTPAVTIEWKQHSTINVGQESRCDLVIKNTSQTDATGVEVQANFPVNVRLLDANPKPSQSNSFLGWEFAQLKAGEEKVIEIRMIPMERGNIATRASVRFTGTASGLFSVAEPLLSVKVAGPEQVLVGESAPQTITVTNPGNGVTSNIKIEALIPDGLEHARGKRLLMEIGSLNPGESRNIRLAMIAVAGGDHQIQVQARADAGLVQNSVAQVAVIAPSLAATIDGPGLRYLGRQGKFKLTVANDGAAATSNVQVMHKIPEGYEFVEADRGVQYDKSTRLLTWFVGKLNQSEKSEIQVTLLASKIGEQKHFVRATSEHGSLADTEFTTRIEGTSSLSIEVVDLEDPVELGTEAIYEVRVKNDGSAESRDVGIACELAPGVNFVAAEGPANHIVENGLVIFRTIPVLGPGKTATYRVRVNSTVVGNARFRARLTSEAVAEPLTADELTRFYGE